MLGQAIGRDPRYSLALALAAQCHAHLHVSGWTDDPELHRRRAVGLAQRALRGAGDDPNTLGRAAHALGYSGGDLGAATALVDRCLELNPSYASGWINSGWLRLWAGQPDLAIEHLETGLRLNPRDRHHGAVMGIGVGHFFARRLENAAAMLLRSLQERPNWVPTYRFLASCYAHMGRLDEARETIDRVRQITLVVVPSATHWRDPDKRAFYLEGLRLAAGETT